ncbi:MAG: helix-turn-helix domain-containing protein [Bacillota bacterium]
MGVKDRIRNLRENKDLTRKELAELINYSEDYIYKIETGKREVSIAFLDKISQAFNMPRSYFFKDDEIKYQYSEDKIKFEEFIMEHEVEFYGEDLDAESKKKLIELIKTAIKFRKDN